MESQLFIIEGEVTVTSTDKVWGLNIGMMAEAGWSCKNRVLGGSHMWI